jgi:hypothetical protein
MKTKTQTQTIKNTTKKVPPLAVNKYVAPVITEKKRKKAATDLMEIADSQLLLSIDLKRQPESVYDSLEIDADQKFFPYTVVPRLLVGWQAVTHISSMEMKFVPGTPLPQLIVRFVEKMTASDVKALDPASKAQIQASMALVRQYPFVKVESPLQAT